MSLSDSKPHPFMLITAFTKDIFGGNPAAIIFLDKILPIETLRDIAKNFSQPITSIISPSISLDKSADFEICWLTGTGSEVALCGHGTLAAAKAVTSGLIRTHDTQPVRFKTRTGEIVTARKVEGDEECFEITFPAAQLNPLSPEEQTRVSDIIARAAGKETLGVKFAASGTGDLSKYVMVELDERENLAGIKFDSQIFRETGYRVNVLTTESLSGNEVYLTRMFAPWIGVDEDHVTGSANCLVAPYWAKKKGCGSAEMKAKQVSARGGEFRVIWEENTVKMKGQTKVIGKGEIYL